MLVSDLWDGLGWARQKSLITFLVSNCYAKIRFDTSINQYLDLMIPSLPFPYLDHATYTHVVKKKEVSNTYWYATLLIELNRDVPNEWRCAKTHDAPTRSRIQLYHPNNPSCVTQFIGHGTYLRFKI